MRRTLVAVFACLLLQLQANAYAECQFRFPLDDYRVTGYTFGQSTANGIHLGEDAAGGAGTPVYASGEGQVKHAHVRTGYGLVVIIEHSLPAGDPYGQNVCTLYGHLRDWDKKVSEGQVVGKGTLLGYLGTSAENGGWDPHLHYGVYKNAYSTTWIYQGYGDINRVWHPTQFTNYNHSQHCCTPADVWWNSPPTQNRWYNNDTTLSYGTSGSDLHVDTSALSLSSGGLGSKDLWVHCWNGCGDKTIHWYGGWDNQAPDLGWNGDCAPSGTWLRGAQYAKWHWSDAHSGVKSGWYRWNGGTQYDGGSGIAQLPEGKNTLQVYVEDNAWNGGSQSGNSSTISAEFWLDNTSPNINLTAPSTSHWFNTSQSVGWSITDATSGFSSATMQWDGGATSGVAASGSAAIPEGRHNVTVRATDVAGNTSSQTAGPFWIDLTPPVVSVSAIPAQPDGENGWYITPLLLAVGATDPNGSEGSGIAGVYYALDGGPEAPYVSPIAVSGDGEHPLSARAADNAGNSGSTGTIVKLDTTPPDMGAVTVDAASGRLDCLVASWDAEDQHSGIGGYEYWIGTTAGEDDVRTATSTGAYNGAYAVNLNLRANQTYYFTVRAKNAAGLWSDQVSSDGVTVTPSYYDFAPDFNSGGVVVPTKARTSPNYVLVDTIGQFVVAASESANFTVEHGYWHAEPSWRVVSGVGAAKSYADGASVQIGDAARPVVVTVAPGVFADRFYVEEPNKWSGIAVQYGALGGPTLVEGDRVWIIGKTGSLSGERLLQFASTYYVDHIDPLGPLFIAVPKIGGGPLGLYTPGVLGGVGLNNVGLLVQVYGGVVSYRDPQGRFFYLDNGDGLYDGFGYGIRIICDGFVGAAKLSMPQYGKIVIVTGISSTAIVNNQPVRAIRPRRQSDIWEMN